MRGRWVGRWAWRGSRACSRWRSGLRRRARRRARRRRAADAGDAGRDGRGRRRTRCGRSPGGRGPGGDAGSPPCGTWTPGRRRTPGRARCRHADRGSQVPPAGRLYHGVFPAGTTQPDSDCRWPLRTPIRDAVGRPLACDLLQQRVVPDQGVPAGHRRGDPRARRRALHPPAHAQPAAAAGGRPDLHARPHQRRRVRRRPARLGRRSEGVRHCARSCSTAPR